MSKIITFTDIPTPTNVQAVAVAGGSLDSNTTYYYKIIAVGNTNGKVFIWNGQSLPSIEIAITTDSINKSVKLTFDILKGVAGGYRIFRTKIAGYYKTIEGALTNPPLDAIDNNNGTVVWTDLGYSHYGNNYYPQKPVHGYIDISGTDTFSIIDLYEEDIANGWGVVSRISENTYEVKAAIRCHGITWSDVEKTIIFYDYIDGESADNIFNFGIDNPYPTYGCILIWKTNWLAANRFNALYAYNSTFKLNDYYESRVNNYGYLYFDNGEVINANVDRFRSFDTKSGLIKNVVYTNFDIGFSYGTGIYENNQLFGGSRVFQLYAGGSLRAVGVNATILSYGLILIIGFNCYAELVNCYSDKIATPLIDSTGSIIDDRITFNLTIYNKSKEKIQGANVKIYDALNNLIVDTISDIEGKIQEQEVTRIYYTIDNKTITGEDRTPIKVQVTHADYETKTSYFNYDSSSPAKEQITLIDKILPINFSITRLLSRIFNSGKKITSQELITEGAVEHSAALNEDVTITNAARATYRPATEDILMEQETAPGIWEEAEVIADGVELQRGSSSVVDDPEPVYINQQLTGEVMEAEVIEGVIEEILIIGEIISC